MPVEQICRNCAWYNPGPKNPESRIREIEPSYGYCLAMYVDQQGGDVIYDIPVLPEGSCIAKDDTGKKLFISDVYPRSTN